MTYEVLFAHWCALSADARVVLVTDSAQRETAECIMTEMARPCEVCLYDTSPALRELLAALAPEDLVIVLLSFDTMLDFSRERWFSPFGKPEWLRAKCAFVRLNISERSLREGLSTPKVAVYAKIAQRAALPVGALLRVTNAAGTDLTLRTGPFTTCAHEIRSPGGHCFLPPSETSGEVVPGSANGRIVVDVTLGQVHRFAEELGHFGLVDAPVTLTVREGLLTAATGSPTAEAFMALLQTLPEDSRTLVELGQGLSAMNPTGLIGVDESILDTCHFGFGHHENGTHTDVVIRNPEITPLDDIPANT
ncbi:MAG: hypothetical protein IJ343_11540 [Clostridia bacterium]|nr:hypothetical protein [Clostridia bacterium]